MATEEKDPELHTFKSAQQFPPRVQGSLSSALTTLGKRLKERRYKRTQTQMDDAKRVSDRIMGERDA